MNDRIQEIKTRCEDGIYPNTRDVFYLLFKAERLQRENEAMKEALEWYADDRNYKLGNQTLLGEKARTALSHLKG
ncbi:hypothetical protein J25TS5_04350 [Paenibacillus faecis]|uniref:hypothetical protein n=1 Tax=Paenibacillus faecis TaxID=862114 RepID=UPI001B0ADB2F|nr:hypothetical protein [Paenibacillus faecis]GIO83503.1 hypothetical protein J25TS5_04350 [Paenibacillus faecis]